LVSCNRIASADDLGKMAASADVQELGFEESIAQKPFAFQLLSFKQQAAGQQTKAGSAGALRLRRTLLPSGRL
jgi:hypothetical protein